jgi:hypothetical protein
VKSPLAPSLVHRLKAATRLAVQECGGLHEAGVACGLSTSQLSRLQSAHHPDLITGCAMAALAEYSGTRAFAEFFADLAGCSLRCEPEHEDRDAIPAAAATLSEACEISHVIGQALADGELSPREQTDIRRVASDLRDALSSLEGAMTGETHKLGKK